MAWGVLLITFGVAALLNTFADVTEWTYVGLLALGGVAILGLFLTNRQDWVPLIPALRFGGSSLQETSPVTVDPGFGIWSPPFVWTPPLIVTVDPVLDTSHPVQFDD